MSALVEGIVARFAQHAGEDIGIGKAVFKFDAGDDGVIVIDATVKPASISSKDRAADCTLKLAAPFLNKVLTGEMTCGEVYMKFVRGVDGRQGLAVQIQPFLRKVAAAGIPPG